MCQRIGLPPISTIGFGRTSVSSASRVPIPPASIATFIPPANLHSPRKTVRPVGICPRLTALARVDATIGYKNGQERIHEPNSRLEAYDSSDHWQSPGMFIP